MLKNAYYVKLSDIRHQLFNGELLHSEMPNVSQLPLMEVTGVLEHPFVIVFDKNGQVSNKMYPIEMFSMASCVERTEFELLTSSCTV